MNVSYPAAYPDVYPEVTLEANGDVEDSDLTSEETTRLLSGLEEVVCLAYRRPLNRLMTELTQFIQGNDNTGMAMTFTLISYLREQLTIVLQARAQRIQQAEDEKERRAIEVCWRHPCLSPWHATELLLYLRKRKPVQEAPP
jgi:hypothetical protein